MYGDEDPFWDPHDGPTRAEAERDLLDDQADLDAWLADEPENYDDEEREALEDALYDNDLRFHEKG